MKKVLIVINTLGRAGAETALLEMLRHFDPSLYQVHLYVLMGQGEMIHELPEHVKVLNKRYNDSSVLSKEGKKYLIGQVLRAMLSRGTVFRQLPYLLYHNVSMIAKGKLLPDKLLWRVLSEGGERFEEEYDLAVAYLEGGSAYYVAEHISACRKAAFMHVDYSRAGYNRKLDKDCYLKFDKVFTVSDEVKTAFLKVYPECEQRTEVFHNMLNVEAIKGKALLPGGFGDTFEGTRILTVGRLTEQKALEVSIEACSLLKSRGEHVRWYVLGEGNQRIFLEECIKKQQLEEDFLLLGAVDNPYPYMKQADIYVHASRFEGKSIAIQEAQILGKPILVSDCSGNREQVEHGVDGVMCKLNAEAICEQIQELLRDKEKCTQLGRAAAEKKFTDDAEMEKLLCLITN